MWSPCRRIVRADVPPVFRVRGINAPLLLCWPNAALGGGADYSVDFSSQISCGDVIVSAAFSVSGGALGWGGSPTYTTAMASAWITWSVLGPQTVAVTVLTRGGVSLSAVISIVVVSPAALIAASAPAVAPNVLTLPDGTPLLSTTGRPLLTQ